MLKRQQESASLFARNLVEVLVFQRLHRTCFDTRRHFAFSGTFETLIALDDSTRKPIHPDYAEWAGQHTGMTTHAEIIVDDHRIILIRSV